MRLPFQDKFEAYQKKRKKNNLDWKKRVAELQKKLAESEADRTLLYDQVQAWKVQSRTAYGVIDAIMDEGIKWFDPATLDQAGERRYRLDAKVILENRTFQNEIQRMEAEMVKWAVLKSTDFADVRDMRHQISGIKLLRERLEDLKKFET